MTLTQTRVALEVTNSQVLWHTLLIPELVGQRQEDCEYKTRKIEFILHFKDRLPKYRSIVLRTCVRQGI